MPPDRPPPPRLSPVHPARPHAAAPLLAALLLACGTPAQPSGPVLDPALEEPPPAWQRLSAEVMTTRWELVLPGGPQAEGAAREAFDVLAAVEVRMNEWKPGSPLAEVNRLAGGKPVPVPPDLLAILKRSKELALLTEGAFDVTWAALWGLWTFRDQASPPDPAEIAKRLAKVDHRKLELDEAAGTARLAEPGMAVGLGAIAKGWALDRAAERLKARGLHDWFLSGGGQVLAGGTQAGKPWQVGLRDPRGPEDEPFALLPLQDGESVSTSGDYERFFEHEGKRYHHILDPRTGYPSQGLRSAVVLAREATLADALSTALLVLGRERALALVAKLPNVQAVLVDDDGRLFFTAGLKGRLRVLRPPRP